MAAAYVGSVSCCVLERAFAGGRDEGIGSAMTRAAVPVLLLALTLVASPSAAVPAPQQISVDPFTDTDGQHETAVEPDSFSIGNDIVAVFQVGRKMTGGASGIGYATSHDGGRTWRSRVLPFAMSPGSLDLVSDPAIAYDRVHSAWVASVLGGRIIRSGDEIVITARLLAARSSDGVSWTTSVVDPGSAHDKTGSRATTARRAPTPDAAMPCGPRRTSRS